MEKETISRKEFKIRDVDGDTLTLIKKENKRLILLSCSDNNIVILEFTEKQQKEIVNFIHS